MGASHGGQCQPSLTPRGNMDTWMLLGVFLCTYRLQSSLHESEISCGKHFSHLGLNIEVLAIITNKQRSSEGQLEKDLLTF